MIDFEQGLRVLRAIEKHTVEHPIKAEAIQESTGVNWRTVTDIVSCAASNGVPVGSGGRGYFWWHSREEKELYIQQEESRLIALGKKLSAIKKSEDNPLTFWDQL